jgi:hypothetical protein
MHVQRLVLVVKMATVLEEYYQREAFCCAFLCGHKDIKEMFRDHGGECLSRKAVHNCIHQPCKRFADGEEVETEVQKWLETTVKRLMCCGFRRTGKAMG